MRLIDLIKTGWAEIWLHKMRSFLSFFAIAIGIATFFYTLSVLSQSYHNLGKAEEVSGKGRIDTEIQHTLSLEQYEELKAHLPEGISLSFVTDRQGLYGGYYSAVYKGQKLYNGFIVGVMPTWKDSNFVYKLEGRFISQQDIENKNKVALLVVFPNEKEKRRLWGTSGYEDNSHVELREFTKHHNLLNQNIVMQNESFKIIGILHVPSMQEDYRLIEDRDRYPAVLIPYTTWLSKYSREKGETSIRILTGKESTARIAAKSLTNFLRSRFGPEEKPNIEFFSDTLQTELKNARKSLNKMLFMGIIAMIAGGIGIMNVTMAVIFSRTKEIGIRRALGASRKDILFQFLVEAMLLGFLGSCAGMVLGYIAVLHLAKDISQMTFAWWVVALSVLIALITSFLFALYPAWQAAKLKPVDALRSD